MIVDKSLFIDSLGKLRTTSLFMNLSPKNDLAVFNLREEDSEYQGRKIISLKRLYMAMEDPTEYLFATTYLYSYQHWERMCNNKLIAPHVEQWRKELELKMRAKGFKQVLEAAQQEGNIGYNASKFLVEKGWKDKATKGRPSKAEKEKALKQDLQLASTFEEDLKRLKRVK